MTVLITGATGLIGKEVVKLCHKEGFNIHYLTTSKEKIENQPNYKGFYWDPKSSTIDPKCFEDVEAIINLVGASISKRWTSSYKREVLESRTKTAELLYETIKAHNFDIKQVVSASAIGIYPTSSTNYYEETFSEAANSFLGEVVKVWETTVDKFKSLDIKVSKIRIGLVMAKDGGALPEMVKPIRLGVGAAFGSGNQWQSWIHVADVAGIFVFAIKNKLEGIYNAVAPNAVTNKELTKVVASVLKKPLVLPNIPKFTMKLMLGEMHMLLFESQRVSAIKIESRGYSFKFSNLRPALEDLLL